MLPGISWHALLPYEVVLGNSYWSKHNMILEWLNTHMSPGVRMRGLISQDPNHIHVRYAHDHFCNYIILRFKDHSDMLCFQLSWS